MSGMDFAAAGANLGRALMGGSAAYETGRSRMAQELADMGYKQAQGEYYKTKAENERQRASYQTPEFAGRIAGALAGLSDEQAGALENYSKTGNWGMSPAMPDEAKQMTMAPAPLAQPDWATPEVRQRYNTGKAAHLINLGGTGDSNADQITKAFETLLGQNRIDAVVADPSRAAALGKAIAASQGKALFNQGSNGVMDNFTGVETINDVGRSVIGENNAQATNAYASAGAHNASRQKTLAEIDGVKSGNGAQWQVVQTAQGAVQVNPKTGEVRPLLMDGKPIISPKSQAKETQDTQASISTQQVLDQAATLFDHPGREMGTGFTSISSMIPGTDARGFKANLDTFKAQTFIPMVSALKGMGALSDAEGKKLADSVGALDPSMPEEEFARSLKGVTRILFDKAKASGLNVSLPEFAIDKAKDQPVLPTPNEAAIAHLRSNPNLAPAFAAKYGKAATDAALGKVR